MAAVFVGAHRAVASSNARKATPRWAITSLPALPGWPIIQAVAINDRGQVVGTSSREFGDDNQFIECHAVLWQGGRATDVSARVGDNASCQIAINERGQVLTDEGFFGHAWLVEREKLTDLGALPGQKYSEAIAINNRAQVIGESFDGPPFVWDRGTMTALGKLGGQLSLSTAPRAISDQGWVVGHSGMGNAYHAFVWRGGRMTDLGTLGGQFSDAIAVNDRGQIVGEAEWKRFHKHAFLWRNSRMTDLGALPRRPYSAAVAINERTQIMGTSEDADGGSRAFSWQNGRMIDLGTLGGCCSTPTGINGRGQIVGYSSMKSGTVHAFIWESGKMTDLGTLGTWSRALDINERGQVVGQSKPKRGRERAVLWSRRPN
jgi:probable HAF family extracellular repeat protein